jgi:LmbE family N-acetylglucosaminyl deacetylase
VILHAGPPPAQDAGAAGAWQKLLKLQTTASAMHTTAHPDDEHGGMLTQLSRGLGARVSLLTLTRGESGDNAIGAELFDAVALIRTEELLVAGRYYGLDHQYFTTAIDYGFSKRLEEALAKWGRENVLRDMVRVIRVDRPFVLIARFQGNARDGHGNHEAAGILTQEAFRSAGDPSRFPEQIGEGLRPWQPLKLYMGGVREAEDWTLRIDPGEYSPWLGESYQTFARLGLAFQRSQNGGRVNMEAPSVAYYKRLATADEVRLKPDTTGTADEVRLKPDTTGTADEVRLKPDTTGTSAPASVVSGSSPASVVSGFSRTVKEDGFFDGIDTSISGIFNAIRRPAPAAAAALLSAIDVEVRTAVAAFTMQNPSASVPALARGLSATRTAIRALRAEPDAVFILQVKEQQFMDAINTALGIDFQAIAAVAGPIVPSQRVAVDVSLTNRGSLPIQDFSFYLVVPRGWQAPGFETGDSALGPNTSLRQAMMFTAPDDAPLTRPYFERATIAESRYTLRDISQFGRSAADPAVTARATYAVAGVPMEIKTTVKRREPHLPYGEELRELMIVPAVAVNVTPRVAIVPLAWASKRVDVRVELLNNAESTSTGSLALRLPPGWTSAPVSAPFTFARAGERTAFRFSVAMPSAESRDYRIEAVATIAGRSYAEGYDVIEHRDLETRYLYHPASTLVRGVDVAIAPGLKVGYVMGIGDEVPAGIAQLGASVTLLGEQDLAAGDLRRYDAIVTGTRAYAVREDLKTYNRRLLDYVQQGGNLIVLYNTQEFVPNAYAPFPAQLPARAEEVSEEDSPVDILAPSHRAFTTPNRITKADFDGWVEQRGSKFFTEWDAAYTPMIATHDQGQAPQRGGWVTATYGKGHYTYFAYAFHRQLPYGVPGAYRLLANLLSLGK